jgi:uncharacterized protein YciU (UPF0263 family)
MTLEQWLIDICDNESPDALVIAYHLGLFENIEGSTTLYLVGSSVFHESDEDWIANVDFEPEDNYHTINEIGLNNLSPDDLLEQVRNKLVSFTETEQFRNSFFAKAEAITLGFDDGDLIRIK